MNQQPVYNQNGIPQQQQQFIQQPMQQQYIQQPIQQQQFVQQPVQQQFVQQQNLSVIDQVFGPNKKCLVKQRFEPFEFLTGFETKNKYDVIMENNLQLVALEDSDVFSRLFCGNQRAFKMHICFSANKQQFLRLERPWRFLFHEINVFDHTTNKYLGAIRFKCSCCTKNFDVVDANNQVIYKIHGPFCSWWTFYIKDLQGNNVGKIAKKWSGLLKEMYTDADNFGVEFPANATPAQKAVLFGATFLIDFLYFEDNHKNN